MAGYFKRLLSALAAYQLSTAVSGLIGILLLPVYTHYLKSSAYGTVEVFATAVIFASIVVRFGMIEAFLRYHFAAEDAERRAALARRAVLFLLVTTTVVVIPLVVFAGPLSKLVLSHRDTEGFLIAVLGLWSFTNLELAYGLLRVEERLKTYAVASVSNALLTIVTSVVLVVGAKLGANGLMLANYGATFVVLLAVWWTLRDRLLVAKAPAERFGVLLRFGLPTVPAEASAYALSLVDRQYIIHELPPGRALSAAGLYAIGVKFAGAIALMVRAFQYAWPPLAYSVKDDADAARLYGLIATYYMVIAGWVVAGSALLGRWVLHVFTHPEYYGANRALAWLALGWAMYGLWVVFLAIAGRAKVTTRNMLASVVGLTVNVVLLVLLVPPLGIRGAGIALCGAYAAMLTLMYFLTRGLFRVGFEWRRLGQLTVICGGLACGGEFLLPTHGVVGLVTRAAVFLAIPPALYVTGFAHPQELAQARVLLARLRRGMRPA
jgi:O-antigen/teichoic acid export membrane protein